jgi:tellurite resistance protein TerC
MEVTAWHWLAFGGLVIVLLALDLFVFHRDDREPSLRESAAFTVFWVSLAIGFNVLLGWWDATQRGTPAGWQTAGEFLAGYLLEWSLSIDNVFVFVVIFRFFQVPKSHQYRVLFWGILGAIVLRLTFVLAGAALISRFDWVMPIFGLFLIYTAYKLARHSTSDIDPEKNLVRRVAQRLLPIAEDTTARHHARFFFRRDGKLFATPLLLVLLVVESTDVLFAIDSVPAIFGITKDSFIVFTSNIFAILGLRALYFLLAGLMGMFRYLHFGLAAVLAFVGLKMIGQWWFPQQHVPIWLSLVVIGGLLGISVVASLVGGSGRGEKENR